MSLLKENASLEQRQFRAKYRSEGRVTKEGYYNTKYNDRNFRNALTYILKEIYFSRLRFYGIISTSNPLIKKEPKGKISYNQKICRCGQVFYTDSFIPHHICLPK